MVVLTEYFYSPITTLTEGLEVQFMKETGGASLSVPSSDTIGEPSSPSLDSYQPAGRCAGC